MCCELNVHILIFIIRSVSIRCCLYHIHLCKHCTFNDTNIIIALFSG